MCAVVKKSRVKNLNLNFNYTTLLAREPCKLRALLRKIHNVMYSEDARENQTARVNSKTSFFHAPIRVLIYALKKRAHYALISTQTRRRRRCFRALHALTAEAALRFSSRAFLCWIRVCLRFIISICVDNNHV